jgi:hypothetical protein
MSSTKPTEIATDLQEIRLRGGHLVEIASNEESATLRLRSAGAGEGLEIEVAWTPQGPLARVRAASIDLQTTADVSLRCNSFAIEASQGISLRAQGNIAASGAAVAVEAREGRVVARANDDVQLLGEQVLLNCDRTPEIPDWVKQGPGLMMPELVALAEASGDDELIAAVRGEEDKGDASR